MYSIFLADDEVWETLGLKKLIEKSELPIQVVGQAENGIGALKALQEIQPDILITDIRMPGLNGLELSEKIRELGLKTEIILLSGYAEFEYARTALRFGIRNYLLKPVSQENLNEVLGELVAEKDKKLHTVSEEEVPESNIERIFHEIEVSYMEDITLNSLADKYNISASRLSIRVKEILGMSFSKYLTSKRIQKAKELLEDDRLSVEQIAEMVGYRDYFYFTKVFKKTEGVSPSSYRKNRRAIRS